MVAGRFVVFCVGEGESAMIGSAHVGAAAQSGARLARACAGSSRRSRPAGESAVRLAIVWESRSVSAEVVETLYKHS